MADHAHVLFTPINTGTQAVSALFRIPGPALISFSGGATSAYMLWRTIEDYGGTLPDDVHVAFANTGKEREETLRFVHECASRWKVKVHWLEWRTRATKGVPFDQRFAEVGLNSADRTGKPFAELIDAKGFLPNSVMRFCTDELKIKVMRNFMQSLGYERWTNVIGLRADEMHRVIKSRARSDSGKERWVNSLPLADAGVTVRDVAAFWDVQDFRLQLLPFEGNCDGCFLKARPKLFEVERTAPGTLQWWAEQERKVSATFRLEYGYASLIDAVQRQPDMFAGVFDNDPAMDVACGDWCEE